MVGTKFWFRPRGWGGWGWAPASWEGWVALIAYLSFFLANSALGRQPINGVITGVATCALIGLCIAKGTPPGGRRMLAEFREEMAARDWQEQSPPRARDLRDR